IDLTSAVEEIFLRDVEVVQRAAAVVGEVGVDVGRERIVRLDDDVDYTVVRWRNPDRHGFEKVELPKIALGFAQLRFVQLVAFIEQQKLSDERFARRDLDAISDAIQAA